MIETSVTLICSSTSALVNCWKSHVATYLAPPYSRLCSRCGELATRFKSDSRVSSDTQTYPTESRQSKPYSSLYKLNHVDINGDHQESASLAGNTVRTEIGGGSPTSEVENGVIRKIMKVEQSFN